MALFETKKKYKTGDSIVDNGYGIIYRRTITKEEAGITYVLAELLFFFSKEDTYDSQGRRDFAKAILRKEVGFPVTDVPLTVEQLYPQVECELVLQGLVEGSDSEKEVDAIRKYFKG